MNILEMPKDLQRKIALKLSPPELIRFCKTNKSLNIEICESNDFWRLKLEKDYPELFNYFSKNKLILKNPKNTYMRRFTEISTLIENFVQKEIVSMYRPYLYNMIYQAYQEYVKRQQVEERKAVAFEPIYRKKVEEITQNPEFMYRNQDSFSNQLNNLVISLEMKRRMYFTN